MTQDKEAFQRFFRTGLDAGWGLLQHYLCRNMPHDKHMNMTGGGLGNVFGAVQRPGIPLSLFGSSVQTGSGSSAGASKVCVNMVSPTEAALDQAKSELQKDKKTRPKAIKRPTTSKTPHSAKTRRTVQKKKAPPAKKRPASRNTSKKQPTKWLQGIKT